MEEVQPGPGWADVVSKILRMGSNKPEANQILSKAKLEEQDSSPTKPVSTTITFKDPRRKPDPQADALLENQLKEDATRGVVHLFNAVKAVNPKTDKKRKKKKKKKPTKKKSGRR